MALLPMCSFPELEGSAILEGVQTKLRIFKQRQGEQTSDQANCLKRIQGKYILLIFYPRNFDPIAQLELISFSESLDTFEDLNCEMFGCSTESVISHLDWLSTPRSEGGLEHLQVPLIPDTTGSISASVGMLQDGCSMAALYLLDPAGLVRYVSITDPTLKRSPREVIRILKLLKNSKSVQLDTEEIVIELWNTKEIEAVNDHMVDNEILDINNKVEEIKGDIEDLFSNFSLDDHQKTLRNSDLENLNPVKNDVEVTEEAAEQTDKVLDVKLNSIETVCVEENCSLDFLDLSVSLQETRQKEKFQGVPPKVKMRRKNASESDKTPMSPEKKNKEIGYVRQASVPYIMALDIIDNVFDSAYNSLEKDSYTNENEIIESSPTLSKNRKNSLKKQEMSPIISSKITKMSPILYKERKEPSKIVRMSPLIPKDKKDSPKVMGMSPIINKELKDSPNIIGMSPLIPNRQKDSPKVLGMSPILSKELKDSPKVVGMSSNLSKEQNDTLKIIGMSPLTPKEHKDSPALTKNRQNSPQIVKMSPIIPQDRKDSINIAGKGPVKLKSIVKTTGTATDTEEHSTRIIEKNPISQLEQNTPDDDKRVKDKMIAEDSLNTEKHKTVTLEQNSSIAPRHRSRSKKRPPRETVEHSFSSESNEEQRTENLTANHLATNDQSTSMQTRARSRRRPPRELSMSSESNEDWTITEKSVAAAKNSAVSILAPRQRSLSMRRPPRGVIDQSMSSDASNDESGREYRLDKMVTFQKGANDEDFRKVIMTSAVKNPPILVKAKTRTDPINPKLSSGRNLDERTRSNTRANAVNGTHLPVVVKPRASSAVSLTRTSQPTQSSNCNIQ